MTGQRILSPQMKRDAILQFFDFFQKQLIRHRDFTDLGEQRFLFGIGGFVAFLRFQCRFSARQHFVTPFRQIMKADAIFPGNCIKRLSSKYTHDCIHQAYGRLSSGALPGPLRSSPRFPRGLSPWTRHCHETFLLS